MDATLDCLKSFKALNTNMWLLKIFHMHKGFCIFIYLFFKSVYMKIKADDEKYDLEYYLSLPYPLHHFIFFVAYFKQSSRRSFKITLVFPVFQMSSVQASQPRHQDRPCANTGAVWTNMLSA